MVGIHISLLANRCCPHRWCTTDNVNSLRVLDSRKKDKPNSSRNSRMNYKVFQEKCIIFVVKKNCSVLSGNQHLGTQSYMSRRTLLLMLFLGIFKFFFNYCIYSSSSSDFSDSVMYFLMSSRRMRPSLPEP